MTTALLRFIVSILLALQAGLITPAAAAQDFLPPEQAFRFEARALDARTVEIVFSVADGYYLYRDRFAFAADGLDVRLGDAHIPAGKVKFDETFGKDVETHRGRVVIRVPVESTPESVALTVTSQGCADAGLCYPPMPSAAQVSLAGFGGDGSVRTVAAAEPIGLGAAAPAAVDTGAIASSTDAGRLDSALRDGRFWPVVGVFFLAGVLLSFTPCVLPMVPILSSIIVGQGREVSRGRGLMLAASYGLGMAMVYTALGVAAGLAGEGLAAALQNPWVLSAFALGLVVLSLSMFGVYELQMPHVFTHHFTKASHRLPAGRIAGVFLMGGVSALIVSPCVAAPLAGALVYLSQTRDVWLGGTALFSLASGMSVPLLLVGASAGALLPRAGGWMEEVKHFFGLLLLGVALWMVQSLLPAALALALWGALALALASLMFAHGRGHRAAASKALWRRAAGLAFGAFGLLQIVGAASGGTDPLQPLAHLNFGGAAGVRAPAPSFAPVRSSAELDAALQSAAQARRVVMLDFYADWCVSCKEMERYTYADPAVQARLANAVLLKADVTANNAQDKELLKRFGLFGPPGTIFFDPASGREVAQARVIGFQNGARFLRTLETAGL